MARVPFDPTVVDDATALFTVGGYYWNDGKRYRYIKVVDANVAAGDVLVHDTSGTGTQGTKNRSGSGTALANDPVIGVAVGAITATQHGFVLVQGPYASVKVNAAVAAGDPLQAENATAGSAVITSTVGKKFGRALAAASGGVAPVQVEVQA